MTFYEKLRSIQRKNKSLLCIGLDPDIRKLPGSVKRHKDPVYEFNRAIVAATFDLVCAYKLNLAFYEALGMRAWECIHKTLACIPRGIVTIGDAKRGDIGNSGEMYASALLDDFGFTATTVSPYMGRDSLEPFIKDRRRGAFVLALTSNPGAADFQCLRVGRRPLYEHVIERVGKWNTQRNCGLVVGATRPKEMKRARELAPDMPFLIPGIGVQGGDLKLTVRYGCDARGEMAVINASRGVIYASAGKDFARAARAVALELRYAINQHRRDFL